MSKATSSAFLRPAAGWPSSCRRPRPRCIRAKRPEVRLDGEPVGRLGRLHPEVGAALALPDDVFFFELALDRLATERPRTFAGLSRQPSVRRDLALLLDGNVPASEVETVARERCGDVLADFAVFDLYTGEGVEPGCKSLAISLTFQHRSRTLAEAEINQIVDGALADLKTRLGARLR